MLQLLVFRWHFSCCFVVRISLSFSQHQHTRMHAYHMDVGVHGFACFVSLGASRDGVLFCSVQAFLFYYALFYSVWIKLFFPPSPPVAPLSRSLYHQPVRVPVAEAYLRRVAGDTFDERGGKEDGGSCLV
ncbi:uncharacterized protein K452DRAFT_40607 [Aplosporella prunicola CBS 121167]|uniref:Uncharacterized protein n=1 Tax=Aplosporella prunicola CBS 121167 TaxID=1176127 RepID=A0A6A6BDR7_9PEZI|nr:uncharacterized protein K452DRAFT_40607 [Aplosporella prunicola CBS 121167]KAF2141523.1 hypothetical protein K452DRAFT_40607 [Aplosporella prunicola CBS 121167]